ncbi:MAG: Cell division protein ftsA [Clostridia bacterium 41_269]|nr:MAG: Cell division protein ftsA [Clostridia bacterium 41_269]
MPSGNVVVGLDLGTSNVVVIVAKVKRGGQLDILGVGKAESLGMRKGTIVDIEKTSAAIHKAVEEAERMSGCKIDRVFVGITGPHISSVNNHGVVAVSNEKGEITPDDVQRALQAAKVIAISQDKRIIHILPRQYIVDGFDGISDPVGMFGNRLEVETSIIVGARASIQNTLKSVEKTGLKVEALVFNALAASEAVLQPAEKELGTVLVDIGAGTTEIAIFREGSLVYAAVIPIGGDHITSDLAVGLRTPIYQAEKVKIEEGCVLADLMPDDRYIEIPSVGGQEVRKVSRKMLASIIEPRVSEILTMTKEKIKSSGCSDLLPGGAVITGGSASLQGLAQLAEEILELPVRIGTPQNVGGLGDIVNSPAYSTAIGLVCFGAKRLSFGEEMASDEDEPMLGGFFYRLRNWLVNFFTQ